MFNAFEKSYEIGLGMTSTDNFVIEGGNTWEGYMCYILFILASFLISIVFLNMMINIMGDSFEFVMDERDLNASIEKLRILDDCRHLINTDND